jgi:hypothetical protein
VAADQGVASFVIARDNRATNTLEGFGHQARMGGVRETQTVPTTSLDLMLDAFPAPSVVKVDVEGAELMVLEGASRLLSEVRPVIMIEVAGEVAHSVTDVLVTAGYVLSDASSGLRVDLATYNTLALPLELVTDD